MPKPIEYIRNGWMQENEGKQDLPGIRPQPVLPEILDWFGKAAAVTLFAVLGMYFMSDGALIGFIAILLVALCAMERD